LRYAHLAFSLALVLVLFFGLGYQDGVVGPSALIWFAAGNGFYYLAGILLAYRLKDNRAFCKYLCPLSVPLKLTSRFSLLKVKAEKELCTDCRSCTLACPMDIDIPVYTAQGRRVGATECSLCLTCTTVCPQEAIKLSFGLDIGGRDYLRLRVAGR